MPDERVPNDRLPGDPTGARPVLMVLVASIREGRVGAAVGEWVAEAVRAERSWDLDVADLREIRLPLHEEPHHPRLQRYEGEATRRWSARVAAADGFVLVMPEYNHSFSAPLKNALDHLVAEWAGKPVGLVSYGGLSGGTRAAVALQPVLVNLGMRLLARNVELAWVGEHVVDGRFVATYRQDAALRTMLEELAGP